MIDRDWSSASPSSKPVWLRSTRTSMARMLLRFGFFVALGADRLAVWVAPWLMTDVHAEAMGEVILVPEESHHG